ncbi:hypothetical protein [Microbacterium thalassium]|uniref:Uncharacterized protein n=1 Tax=Microbacterium thalassium TaxID=362649 RepID=A0A7X0FPV6_9MICO|nr:hypothetical protein [Microbacterium thalassium]MBB6390952.1 hypothetical protein [Microbacterium thalassium]GLK26061.1 hypothetical protein GCM10017607_33800 [Microbacterium thalassium]
MRRDAVLSAVPLALAALLAGCASSPAAPAVTETVAAATPTPTPTPTPEVLLIGAGGRPPTVFGGDCAAALPATAIEEAVGISSATVEARRESATVANVGGLACSWRGQNSAGGESSGSVWILPQAGLGDAALSSADEDYYFGECEGYWCSWRTTADGLEIIGGSGDPEAVTRAGADAQGSALGALMPRALDDEPWERDRTGWWQADSCNALAAGLGESLGASIAWAPMGYHDVPAPAHALVDIASHTSWCLLTGGEPQGDGPHFAEVRLDAGIAWSVPGDYTATAHPVDAAGVTAYSVEENLAYSLGSSVLLTDGVNVMQLTVVPDGPWPAADVVEAAAEWIASTASQP